MHGRLLLEYSCAAVSYASSSYHSRGGFSFFCCELLAVLTAQCYQELSISAVNTPDFFGGDEILGITQCLGLTWYERHMTTTFETSDGKKFPHGDIISFICEPFSFADSFSLYSFPFSVRKNWRKVRFHAV